MDRNQRGVQWGDGTNRIQAARDLCIERRGICGRDCPNALESFGYRCAIRKIPEVKRGIAAANLAEQPVSAYEKANRRSSLTQTDVLLILDLLAEGAMVKEIARRMKVSSPTVREIRDGIRWREVHRAWHQAKGNK